MPQSLEIFVPEFVEIKDSEWSRVKMEAIAHYSQLLKTYPAGPIDGSATIRNIGKGADWLVVVLVLGGFFFVIPDAHRQVRESLEEWRRIFKELKSFSSWLLGKKRALYPDQYLFLFALFSVAERIEPDLLVFLGFTRLPKDNPDLADMGALLFSFANGQTVVQVAVDRDGSILWENELSVTGLEPDNSFKPKTYRDSVYSGVKSIK